MRSTAHLPLFKLSPRQTSIVLLGAVFAGLVSLACGSTKNPNGGVEEPLSDASVTSVTDAETAVDASFGADASDAAHDAKGSPSNDAAGASCVLSGGGGSSSGNSCTTTESYTCTTGTVEIECSCPAATCTCGASTFNNACNGGCQVPDSIRTQCGAVNIEHADAGGSTSSSSGGK